MAHTYHSAPSFISNGIYPHPLILLICAMQEQEKSHLKALQVQRHTGKTTLADTKNAFRYSVNLGTKISQAHLYTYNTIHKGSKNLLFTPALYTCNSVTDIKLISVFACTNRTSPSFNGSPFGEDPTLILPLPTVTTKMEGPRTAGNTVDVSLGRKHESISNSSNGGMYLFMYEFKGTPRRISGKPCKP